MPAVNRLFPFFQTFFHAIPPAAILPDTARPTWTPDDPGHRKRNGARRAQTFFRPRAPSSKVIFFHYRSFAPTCRVRQEWTSWKCVHISIKNRLSHETLAQSRRNGTLFADSDTRNALVHVYEYVCIYTYTSVHYTLFVRRVLSKRQNRFESNTQMMNIHTRILYSTITHPARIKPLETFSPSGNVRISVRIMYNNCFCVFPETSEYKPGPYI